MFLKTEIEFPEITQDEVANYYLSAVYTQVHKQKFNYLGSIVGRPRTGKSLWGCTSGVLLDPTFWDDFENRIVYDAKSFMRALNRLSKLKILGGVILWDEAGVGLPAREWYDMSNKAINYAVQVAGVYRPIIYFITLDLTYIDTQPRKVLNSLQEMNRTNNKYSISKPYNINVDKKRGKIYFKYPRMIMKETGSYIKCHKLKITRPPKEIENRYEEHSIPFKDKIIQIMQQRAGDFEDGIIPQEEYTAEEIIQKVIDSASVYEGTRSEAGSRNFSRDLIKHDFKIPTTLANVIKARAEQILNEKERDKFKEELGSFEV